MDGEEFFSRPRRIKPWRGGRGYQEFLACSLCCIWQGYLQGFQYGGAGEMDTRLAQCEGVVLSVVVQQSVYSAFQA